MKVLIKIFICIVIPCNSVVCGLKELTLEEKLGQLIIAPACPQRSDDRHVKDLKEAIERWHVGGFLLKQGTLKQSGDLVTALKAGQEKIPLLFGADAEWGLSMRISDAPQYPRNMTLGAVQDLDLLEAMGDEIGREMRQLGLHLNLAPVIDVNSNPKNPVIYTRSFGDNPQEVSRRGLLIMQGMQKKGILACAKHFPGHGDTFVDSHVDLPYVNKTLFEMEKLELIPFKALIKGGVDFIMTAHLMIPKVDDQPVTLSQKWVSEVLRKQLGFDGIVITDALNMEGIAKGRTPGEVAVGAFLAGHDLLLYGDHIAPRIDEILEEMIPKALSALKQAVLEGVIDEAEIDRRVERILEMKKRMGIATKTEEVPSLLPGKLYTEALTQIGTFSKLEVVALKTVGIERQFERLLLEKGINIDENAPWKVLVLGEIHRAVGEKKDQALKALDELKDERRKTIVVLFGSPYNLTFIPKGIPVIVGYEENANAWSAAAAALAGEVTCQGSLPVRLDLP